MAETAHNDVTGSAPALAPDLAPAVAAWCRLRRGAQARAGNLRSLGGHSAITVGFDVATPDGAGGQRTERLVLKLPPPGVRRQNNFDVLRQVPVLRLLEAEAIPAPRAVDWSEDETVFGSPYVVMSLLEGAALPDLFGPESGRGVRDAASLFEQPLRALARLHAIPARHGLEGWKTVRGPAEEIEHWVQVVRRSSDPDWIALALAVRAKLHALMPADPPIGIVHGDFYSNNWVFDGPALSGIVDWEGASIGPSLLDLGWVAMMYDAESWGPMRRRTMGWHPGPEFFLDLYGRLTGRDLADSDWHRALAGYRLSCITAYYFERHRTGKTHDPAWDVLGESGPPMLRRAADLLDRRAARDAGRRATRQGGTP